MRYTATRPRQNGSSEPYKAPFPCRSSSPGQPRADHGQRRGAALHDRSDVLRCGHARVTKLDAAAAGWVPAFTVDWALEKLGWKNRALLAQQRRGVDVIARYAGA